MAKEVRKELTDLLDELDIDDFMLDTKEKRLCVYYKEDFDILYQRMGAEPQVNTPGYGTPYHFGKVAFYNHKGWRIEGSVSVLKPKQLKSF